MIHIEVEQGVSGLWYATSDELPDLLVAAPTPDELRDEVERVARILLGGQVDVLLSFSQQSVPKPAERNA